MNPNLTAVTLIILALALFFTFTDSEYKKIKDLGIKSAEYQSASDRSKELLSQRDALAQKFNKIDKNEIDRLAKLIPNSIDSVRLIMEMSSLTSGFGVPLKNVQVNVASIEKTNEKDNSYSKKYNSALLSFSISSSYNNFIEILRGIENSLRMIDIVNVNFSVPEDGIYPITVTVRAYWMK